jgi:hypothetical protein
LESGDEGLETAEVLLGVPLATLPLGSTLCHLLAIGR